MIENAGPRFQRAFADEALLERLRVCATDTLSDSEVKNRCQILFRQWAAAYHSTPGMERIVALEKQLPRRKKPVSQAQSRVIQETEREAKEDPFGNDDDEDNVSGVGSSTGPLTSFASTATSDSGQSSFLKSSKKSKSDKSSKKHKPRAFNLEKEKPQILQAIASSSVASTNLLNALKLLNREHIRVSEHKETVNRFETCKALRRQVLRYIHHVESEQWLGSLINANDALVEALMAFEILDKSVDDDSDSEGNEWDNEEAPPRPAKPAYDKRKRIQESFSGLNIGKSPPKNHPTMLLNGQGGVRHDEDDESDRDDENDPFADSNAVHTPKNDRPGMTW